MVAFGHTAIGSLVGLGVYQLVGDANPSLGLLTAGGAGIISHYITDFIPHGHFIKHKDFKSKVYLEIIFNLFLSILVFLGIIFWQEGLNLKFWYVFFGISGAQLPDILDGLIYMEWLPEKGLLKSEHHFHQLTHWHAIWRKGELIDGLPWGKRDIWQVIALLFALYVVIS